MREQVLAYAEDFPDLEFIHVGKISFNVSRVQNRTELQATDEERFSWMRSIFGINRCSSTYAKFYGGFMATSKFAHLIPGVCEV